MADQLYVPAELHQRMVLVARDFRKSPTPSEAVLWQALRKKQIRGAKFRRQHPIGPFVADFCCLEHDLIVEVDGSVHATQVERDHERQYMLEACGYTVLRFTAHDVEQNLPDVVERIQQTITLRNIDE